MFKIIWSKDDALRIKSLLQVEEAEHYDYVLTDNPKDIPSDKVGIVFREDQLERIKPLIEVLHRESAQLMFETKEGWIQLPIQQITYLECFGLDVYVHMTDQSQHLIQEPMYHLEEVLKPYHFIRIGKSFIVSIRKIRTIRTGWNAKLELELLNGDRLEVTRSYVKSFKEALGLKKKEEQR